MTESVLVDWKKCILCQKSTSEVLQCPADSKRKDLGSGYESLGNNLRRFQELGCLPLKTDILSFDKDGRLTQILKEKSAKWHKSCRDKFSNLKLQRAEKRGTEGEEEHGAKKSARRSHSAGEEESVSRCFFCEEGSGELHRASTFNLDANVRRCAFQTNDSSLLAKLSAGDMVAIDALYHTQCLTSLYRRAQNAAKSEPEHTDEVMNCGIALAELVSFIEESRIDSVTPVFKLADLANMYASRLKQMGADSSSRIHTTRLKERILVHCPYLQEFKDGRNIMLMANEDVGIAIRKAVEENCDNDAIILAKAAKIVRRDLLAMEKTDFHGKFENDCQEKSVSQSLLSLVKMIMGGPNIETQSSNVIEAQATLTIAQLIRFNCTVRRRKDTLAMYHTKEREPPLPIYLGLLLHAETRKRGLVDKMCDLGMSVSYNRVLEISTEMGNAVCTRFAAEKIVCPPKLRKGIFTTSAVDNIDHNPSSTTAIGSLHGTGISLFQHPTAENGGQEREAIITQATEPLKRLQTLPGEYANVPPVQPWKEEPSVPVTSVPMTGELTDLPSLLKTQYK